MKSITVDAGNTLLKTRIRILQSALELIKENGYNKVTIPSICKAAGITKSTFYYHYQSKDDLIGDFIDQLGYITENSYAKILLQETYLKQIWAIFQILLEGNIAAGPAIVKQVFISYLNMGNHSYFPHSATSWNIVVKLLEKAQEDGQFKNNNYPENIAESTFELLRGVLITWAIEDGSFDLEETSKRLLTTLLLPAEGYDL
jgi:AcrR family transcriptional regulator